jgi:F-type H+-transporting ATPase subunit gamma
MPSMRDIRVRIKSVNETKQITKAMKLISASKLRKAKEQFEVTVPFFFRIQSTMKFILSHTQGEENLKYFEKREKIKKKKIGFVVVSGDKTLCGGYNINVMKTAESAIKEIGGDNDVKLFVVGNVGRADFLRKGYNIDMEFLYTVQNPTFYRARDIANVLIDLFNSNQLDEVYLVYTKMINSLKLEPQVMKILPLEAVDFEQTEEESHKTEYLLDFAFKPSMDAVFERLVPQYLRGIVFGALVEAFTSEQSARMTAMDSATRNADEIINKLTLYYNRARQAAITQEITEVIGGAETIK